MLLLEVVDVQLTELACRPRFLLVLVEVSALESIGILMAVVSNSYC